ncbi:low temperature essential protein [Niveomyces insectorum RCEF 264]|uniref:Low temperature essential protein n=1 Tax=Niveomyces insectorum RCEF 264 TaxID=1081102 RepID=A0A167QB45_9HYPO|nr:low temperature essential protein [Niveomyces insectorum RCEF 264]
MEALFELPIQSPTGDGTTVARPVSDTRSSPRLPLSPASSSRPRTSVPGAFMSANQRHLSSSALKARAKAKAKAKANTKANTKASTKETTAQMGTAAGPAEAGRIDGLAATGDAGQLATGSSGGSLRDMRLRRPALVARDGERPTTMAMRTAVAQPKTRRSPKATGTLPKPLLPLTERKSQEENKYDRRTKTNQAPDAEKWDIAPDGSSAGREGRQFTVANVGNNGRIYLRPTVRPAHLRFPQPTFVFPMTPPGTAGLEAMIPGKDRRGDQLPFQQQQRQQQKQQIQLQRQIHNLNVAYGGDWSPEQAPSLSDPTVLRPYYAAAHAPRTAPLRPTTAGGARPRPGGGHRRAVSDSTVQDTSIARESDPGGFRIIITKPADEQRGKTLEDLDQNKNNHGDPSTTPFLEIAIPSWKLGTPQFTRLGTPVLNSSSYAPTDDVQSNRRSYFNLSLGPSPFPQEEHEDPISPRRGIFEHQRTVQPAAPLASPSSPSVYPDDQPSGPPTTYHSSYVVVEPAMFDALTFKPACDDRAIVRFSPATLAITAATPPRLVAEITSPKFMDYDLVSDFFLTYRAFMESSDLLRMLIARLRWAVARDDEAGMVVRVRTFVALRHWILNYFLDDFVLDYGLRVLFCNLLNSFVDELSQDPRGRKVQLKILTELKKCWRRSCAQYWDGPEFDDSLGPEVPITQGGVAGHRDPTLDPGVWEQASRVDDVDNNGVEDDTHFLTHLQSPESMVAPEPPSSFRAEGARTGHIDSIVLGDQPPTLGRRNQSSDVSERRQASPVSITSLDFVSCSFPTKNMRLMQATLGHPLNVHPVDPGSMLSSTTGPVATTPRALVGKRVRPSDHQHQPPSLHAQQQHNRNNSLTDSLRDHSSTTEKQPQRNADLSIPPLYAGSLVRGAILPPGQPYVEVIPSGVTDRIDSRQTMVFSSQQVEGPEPQKEKASAMSGQGMKKLLSSVRRALSTKGLTVSPTTHATFINISPPGPRGATTNRLPGTAIVPQARPRLNGVRVPVRIDLLGAQVAQDFKMAVREDALLDAAAKQEDRGSLIEDRADSRGPEEMDATLAYSDSIFYGLNLERDDSAARPGSDAGITTGSKSIVIVDDTVPLDLPIMTGALPANGSSMAAFSEAYMTTGADPTPPTTPPGQAVGTPRQSDLLDQQVAPSLLSVDSPSLCVPREGGNLLSAPLAEPPMSLADDSILPSSGVFNLDSNDIILPRPPVEDSEAEFDKAPGRKASNSLSMASFSVARRSPPSWIQGHSRHRSGRSHRSNQSLERKRFASFTSGVVAHSTARSFDATTYSEASVDRSPEASVPQPFRVLRRRPGGDLKAVKNVGDLDQVQLRRSRSVGSLTTYTDSIRSSYVRSRAAESGGFVDVVSVDYSHNREEAFSVGMITKPKPTKRLSHFSTYSSRPVMRPSFEAEAQKLAQIPDDVDDDGGVESALLKLEGKFQKKPRDPSMPGVLPQILPGSTSATTATAAPIMAPISGLFASHSTRGNRSRLDESSDHRHRHVLNSELAPSELSRIPEISRTAGDALSAVGSAESHQGDDEIGDGSTTTFSRVASPAFSPPPAVRPTAVPRMADDVQSFLSEESEESYSSIPLLDRGLTDDGRSRGGTTDKWGNRSVLDDESNSPGTQQIIPAAAEGTGHGGTFPEPYEMVTKTESIEKIRPGNTMPQSPQSPHQGTEMSFLDDESDNASDLSSELSAESVEGDQIDDIYGPVQQGVTRSNTVASRLPVHPLGDPELEPVRKLQTPLQEQHPGQLVEEPFGCHPPSPPITLVQALQMSPETAKIPELHDHQLWEEKPLPPTPLPLDTTMLGSLETKDQLREAEIQDGTRNPAASEGAPGLARSEAGRKFSVHLPFILAFDSDVLAQQFTLIEKDALHEIDWRELIEMRWKNAGNSNARSWVEFLRSTDARGIEVVVARFNIMVKWAISEVILTQDVAERARCIVKFIHIAAHCRRYRNYATMSQITIALTSNEVNRRTKTWSLVPPADARTLRDLEALVSPTRNFYNLRAEMEAVGIDNADTGCIPFVGIYTHDLLFNAQRPSEIASSPTTPPLVNFERCRVAASIVKTLLRLVEASALYNFQPVEGITERCLWMSALSDDDIRKFSEALE